MEFDVLCVGAATLDTIVSVEEYPDEDERVVADTVTTAGGGPAATAAVALARLGARVAFCGAVGADDAGTAVRGQLEAEGVDVRWLTATAPRTPQSVVVVARREGTRTIVTGPGAEPAPESVPVAAAGWVHVDQTGHRAVRAAVTAADTPPPRLSIDGGNPITGLRLEGVALYAPTVAALRRRYPGADTVTGAVAHARADGAAVVVATDGSRGAVVGTASVTTAVPAFETAVVSTLGAGDVFHGALLAALVRGLVAEDAARYAAAAAALSCRSLDGRSGIPDHSEVAALLASASPATAEAVHAR